MRVYAEVDEQLPGWQSSAAWSRFTAITKQRGAGSNAAMMKDVQREKENESKMYIGTHSNHCTMVELNMVTLFLDGWRWFYISLKESVVPGAHSNYVKSLAVQEKCCTRCAYR